MVNWPPPSNNSIPPQGMSPLQKAASVPAQAAKPATPPASEPAAPTPATEPARADTSEVRGINASDLKPNSLDFNPTSTASGSEVNSTTATSGVEASSDSQAEISERLETTSRIIRDLQTNGIKPEIQAQLEQFGISPEVFTGLFDEMLLFDAARLQ